MSDERTLQPLDVEAVKECIVDAAIRARPLPPSDEDKQTVIRYAGIVAHDIVATFGAPASDPEALRLAEWCERVAAQWDREWSLNSRVESDEAKPRSDWLRAIAARLRGEGK